jgi:hypothetical protein
MALVKCWMASSIWRKSKYTYPSRLFESPVLFLPDLSVRHHSGRIWHLFRLSSLDLTIQASEKRVWSELLDQLEHTLEMSKTSACLPCRAFASPGRLCRRAASSPKPSAWLACKAVSHASSARSRHSHLVVVLGERIFHLQLHAELIVLALLLG